MNLQICKFANLQMNDSMKNDSIAHRRTITFLYGIPKASDDEATHADVDVLVSIGVCIHWCSLYHWQICRFVDLFLSPSRGHRGIRGSFWFSQAGQSSSWSALHRPKARAYAAASISFSSNLPPTGVRHAVSRCARGQ